MRCRRPLTPALAARSMIGVLLVLLTVPFVLLTPAATGAPAPTPSAAATEAEPLRIQIDQLTPSVLTGAEQVEISGTVTNESEETWTTINVHSFHSPGPLTDAPSLAAAADLPTQEYVGDRVTTAGTFTTIERLDPGASATFSAFIPAGSLLGGDGVYWAGVHVIAQSATQERDLVGRGRTFVPLLSTEQKTLPAALVLPLRAPVRHTPAGRIANPARWAELLGPGGRLRNLLEAGAAAGDQPLTWLVDPAVPHAVWKLAGGNPRASLDPLPGTEDPDGEDPDGETDTATPSGEPATEEPSGGSLGDTASPTDLASPTAPSAGEEDGGEDDGRKEPEPSAADEAAAAAASGWLELFTAEMAAHPVLALPYGDVDASALQATSPELLAVAREQATELLALLGITATPVLAGPDGHLSPEAVEAATPDTLMLLSDRAIDPAVAGTVPTTGQLLGHTFATTSSGVAAGGPGPEPAAGPVAVRQRVVSEAALRLLQGDRSPLVIAPPPNWDPATGAAELYPIFTDGLLRLRSLDDLVGEDVLAQPQVAGDGAAPGLPPEALIYGEEQRAAELPVPSIRAAELRLERARLLAGVLTRPAALPQQTLEVVLPSVSYFARRRSAEWRSRTVRGTRWLDHRLESIRVQTPLRATLSSDHGTLGVTVINGLDVSVTVNVKATTQGGLEIEEPEPLVLAPRARRRLRLAASATREGKEDLTLSVTNAEGTPLGASATYPVRTSQVSGILWVIMGVGASMLFGAIGLRLFRRVRAARREQAELA